jgi:hypothetical protein
VDTQNTSENTSEITADAPVTFKVWYRNCLHTAVLNFLAGDDSADGRALLELVKNARQQKLWTSFDADRPTAVYAVRTAKRLLAAFSKSLKSSKSPAAVKTATENVRQCQIFLRWSEEAVIGCDKRAEQAAFKAAEKAEKARAAIAAAIAAVDVDDDETDEIAS